MSRVEVFPVFKSDYNELALFLSKSFQDETRSKDFWLKRLSFWWDTNPAFSENLERGWVLKDDDKIVGFLGNVPTFFQLLREKTTVFNSTNWRVHPAYRGEYSLSLFLKLIDLSKESMLFDTTPADNVVKILKLLKFENIFSENYVKNYVFINPIIFLQIQLSNFLSPRLLANLFSPVNNLLNLLITKKSSKFYEVKQIDKADDSFDELWEKTKTMYYNTNVRTSEVINWCCFNIPEFRKIVFACYADNHQLLGYMICMISEENNIKRLICADIWGYLDDDKVVHSLVNKCLRYVIENNYYAFVIPYFNDRISVFFKNPIFLKRSFASKYFIKADSRYINNIKKHNSYFVYLQGDIGL